MVASEARRPCILVIEDDPSIRECLALSLELAGFDVIAADHGPSGLSAWWANPCDLIMLDLGLPGMDGFEVCRLIRRHSDIPIIAVSARIDVGTVGRALELGADDFVCKPYEIEEVVARVRSVLRRSRPRDDDSLIRLGHIIVDPAQMRVTKKGLPLHLTRYELGVLMEMARHPDRVYTREMLYETVWELPYLGGSHTVDMTISRLRAKVEPTRDIPS